MSAVYSAQNLAPRYGPTLFVVPKSLLLMWTKQWADTIEDVCDLRLVTAHGQITRTQLGQFGHPGIVMSTSPDVKILQPAAPGNTIDTRSQRLSVTSCVVITTSGSYHFVQPLVTRCGPDRGTLTTGWQALICDECHLEKRQDSGSIRLF